MNIDIQTMEGTLTKVKLNTEGSHDNPTSRSDLTFECLAEGKLVETLVGCKKAKSFYWNKDKQIIQLGIKAVHSEAKLKNATMEFADLKIEDVKVGGIKFQPVNGEQIILTLEVHVYHTGQQLMQFDKLQMTTHQFRIYSAQDDLFPDE